MFEQESGGHRIQRCPKSEKRGRVHSSTVTCAVLPLASAIATPLMEAADTTIEWFSGTGAVGQHRNKHQNSCRLTHTPTGITVTAQCRKRTQSYAQALEQLTERVQLLHTAQYSASTAHLRAQQTGTGMRSDKIRTYRFQDDVVKDHQTGRSAKLSKVMKGRFDLLQ